MSFLHTTELLALGGIATSTAEFVLKYNLVDFLKDKFLGLEKKVVHLTATEFQALVNKLYSLGHGAAKGVDAVEDEVEKHVW